MKAKINEKNFYYNDLTKEITDYILENLDLSINYDQNQYHWPYNLKIDDEEEYLNFTYSVCRIPSIHFVKDDIIGSSGLDSCYLPHIDIKMLLQERKWLKNHKYKYAEIAGVVAHELHHLTQNFDIAIRPKKYSPIVNYFLNPIEIEAFHIGFRAEADISDKTIDACIRKYLDNFLKKRITMKEYEKIRVKWLNPKIKLLKGVK